MPYWPFLKSTCDIGNPDRRPYHSLSENPLFINESQTMSLILKIAFLQGPIPWADETKYNYPPTYKYSSLSLGATYAPTNVDRRRPGGGRVKSNTITNFNWSATNMFATIVQCIDELYWLADQLICSHRPILFDSSAVFC